MNDPERIRPFGSGNVFEDLGLPDAEERLARADAIMRRERIILRERQIDIEARNAGNHYRQVTEGPLDTEEAIEREAVAACKAVAREVRKERAETAVEAALEGQSGRRPFTDEEIAAEMCRRHR